MPCLILTGHPCVGKSTFALKLKERALLHKSKSIQHVAIVNEESACPDQTIASCYADSRCEKSTRSALKAQFDREVAKAASSSKSSSNAKGSFDSHTLVILDSLNYIKGYRYELHCISKAAGERHGVVWLLNGASVAKEWNSNRRKVLGDACFTDQAMDELMQRYEPPDARNRWDKPLYRIDLTPDDSITKQKGAGQANDGANGKQEGAGGSDQAARDALERSVYNMHSLSDAIDNDAAKGKSSAKSSFKKSAFRKTKPQTEQSTSQEAVTAPATKSPATVTAESSEKSNKESERKATTETKLSLEELIDEMLDSFLLMEKPLKEGISTRQNLTADANVLHETDSITQQVCTSIMSSQKMAAAGIGVMGGKLSIKVGSDTFIFQSRRAVSLKELQRHRRQFIRWTANQPPTDTTQKGIVQYFLSYVEGQIS
mmetsp:Transcript_20345/g.31415  ORF Transcript_20345/g.31415 Transcript_20345/m.31415 type:complete len:431 (-) Transcript_20345:227-1519(-)